MSNTLNQAKGNGADPAGLSQIALQQGSNAYNAGQGSKDRADFQRHAEIGSKAPRRFLDAYDPSGLVERGARDQRGHEQQRVSPVPIGGAAGGTEGGEDPLRTEALGRKLRGAAWGSLDGLLHHADREALLNTFQQYMKISKQSAPQLASRIVMAMDQARGGDRQAIAAAERMMSNAWVLYVQALRAPTPGMIYGDPSVPSAAPQASIILRDAGRAPSLAAYLASVSSVNPTYAALRNAAFFGSIGPSSPSNLRTSSTSPVRALNGRPK